MKSQKGMAIHKFVVLIAVLMLLFGATLYVIVQDNCIYEREVEPLINNQLEEGNTTAQN